MELGDLLTKNLGVSEAQAQYGVGLLFKLANEKLGGGDFGKVAAAVPGIDKLIGAVPSAGILGGLGKMLGGGGGLANLAGASLGWV